MHYYAAEDLPTPPSQNNNRGPDPLEIKHDHHLRWNLTKPSKGAVSAAALDERLRAVVLMLASSRPRAVNAPSNVLLRGGFARRHARVARLRPQCLDRPDIVAPMLRVAAIDRATVSDGYIFMAPKSKPPRNFTRTSYIYNNDGGLVWSGHRLNHEPCQMSVFDVCTYRNEPSLCLTTFCGHVGSSGRGSYGHVLDSSYRVVQSVAPSWKWDQQPVYQDMHEFNTLGDGSSALITSYATAQRPTAFHECPGVPNITNITTGIFTEIAMDGSNRTLFAWNAMDHVDPTETVLCPGKDTASWGNSSVDGVDFFHINAVDKNEEGDYLVCARHTSAIYKIAGQTSPSGTSPGEIIWRMGGKRNDFELQSEVHGAGNFNFSFQHHARFIPGGIRLFDNGNSEQAESGEMSVRASARVSSGMDVAVDEKNMVATLVYQAVAPSAELDHSQGSHQGLPNGNHFCGMGSVNEVFERSSTGEVVFDAYLGESVASYRASKHPWTGHPPASELALFTYAHNHSASIAFYASWNGATEVHEYRFFTSNFSQTAFHLVATAKTDHSFETIALGDVPGLYSYAEALDIHSAILGKTPITKTWVPSSELAPACSHLKCAPYAHYNALPQSFGPGIEVKYVSG